MNVNAAIAAASFSMLSISSSMGRLAAPMVGGRRLRFPHLAAGNSLSLFLLGHAPNMEPSA